MYSYDCFNLCRSKYEMQEGDSKSIKQDNRNSMRGNSDARSPSNPRIDP